jgi:hypothetical protein
MESEIINRIKKIHGNLYKFDNFNYVSYKVKVKLICNAHGEFEILLNNLIGLKRGCQKCGINNKQKSCLSNIDKFKLKSNKIHNYKYDYSKSLYVNWKTPLIIICEKHGEFIKTPNNHLNHQGCGKCNTENKKIKIDEKNENNKKNKREKAEIKLKKTTEEFIKKSNYIHSYKYDYLLVKYERSNLKVKIICRKHGIFEQTPHHHKNGNGCPQCSYEDQIGRLKMTTNMFISISKKKHGEYYDYIKSSYNGHKSKIKIICKKHGEFLQNAKYHMNGGGCPKCNCGYSKKVNTNKGYSSEDFYKKCNEKHDNKYTYHDDFKGVKNKIKIICEKHGEFLQEGHHHLIGYGCPKCSLDIKKNKTDVFINSANKLHKNKYDYMINDEFVLSNDKVLIKCKLHGLFEQISYVHLCGSGCSLCKTKSRGELFISNYLKENNIEFIREKSITNIKKGLRFDFYLNKLNTIIEYDGKHHFLPVKYYGGEKYLESVKINDEVKNQYCINNNIKLIRIPYTQLKKIPEILKKELENDKLQT